MTNDAVDSQFYENLVEKLSSILSSQQTDLVTKKINILSLLTNAKKGKRKKNIDLFFVHFCVATLCFLIRNSRHEIEQQFGQVIGTTFITHLFAMAMATSNSEMNLNSFQHQLAGALFSVTLTTFSSKATIDDVFIFAHEILYNLYLKEIDNKLDCLVDMLLCSLVQYENAINQIKQAMARFLNEQAPRHTENPIEKQVISENANTIKKTKDGHTIQ